MANRFAPTINQFDIVSKDSSFKIMKIAHLSTWKCKCGIAEYCELLAHYLAPHADQFVFANCLTEKSQIIGYKSIADEIRSFPSFMPVYLDGSWWGAYDTTIRQRLIDEKPDIMHIQVQTNLYQLDWINMVLQQCSDLAIPMVATFHDSGVWSAFDWQKVAAVAAHRADTMAGFPCGEDRKTVLPRGIPARPVRVGSFAFGRNDHARVGAALAPHGIEFAFHDPFRDGWLSHDDLIEWISKYDAVVLWYPEVAASVSSGALRTALAARRPVYCSNTSWFREADGPLVHKFDDFDAMIAQIVLDFADPMIDQFSFENVAREHLAWYQATIAKRPQ